MEDFLSILVDANAEQRADLLSEALEYGEMGIDFLIENLNNSELIVRAKAYQLLQYIETERAKKAVSQGLLFNPGDKIYCLQKSSIYFNDSSYSLYESETSAKILTTYQDYKNQGFKIINFEESASIITYLPYYINLEEAKLATESLHRQTMSKFGITCFTLYDDNNNEDLKKWCANYSINYQNIVHLQIEQDRKIGISKWLGNKALTISDRSNFYLSWETVIDYLNSIPNLNLLSQLWKDRVGSFATYREITFNKKTYLTLDPYFSEIIINTNNVQYAGNDEAEDSEQAEIDLLIQALDNSQLAVRNTAYQLLKGIDSKRAKKSIDKGVKLKPGDKIYSVYRSGFWFTDTVYLLFDGVDYLEDIYPQVYEEYEVDEQEQATKSKRIFCFVDQEKAEQVAESLHRELIQKSGIGIGGFEWLKKNPDFNLKQWCSDNNIEFDSEWEKLSRWDNVSDNYQIIWKVKDLIRDSQNKKLEDRFRRARYIYHEEHIDTWCKENNVFFDDKIKYFHPEYWNKYREIIDYLYLPENIELLSKFWKDGVGNFAFVREEFVREATYIKIGDNLLETTSFHDKSKLIAVPKNYDELVSDFLIKILNNNKNMTVKFKAYKILETLNTEQAKQAIAQGISQKLGDRISRRQNNALQNDIEF